MPLGRGSGVTLKLEVRADGRRDPLTGNPILDLQGLDPLAAEAPVLDAPNQAATDQGGRA